MAKIRESRRKAEEHQLSLTGKKHPGTSLTVSEKEALREICAKDFAPPTRHGRRY